MFNKIKADVRAAREKNGVYIPHERFAQDVAEKKVDSYIKIPLPVVACCFS